MLTIEEDIQRSSLSESLQKAHLAFCRFLKDNAFSIEPEADGNGWQIIYRNELIGHTNYTNAGVWIDTCDFGGSDSANDTLKETTWAHARACEQCGCGNQPGSDKIIFGRKFEHLCFAHLEFLNPDAETLEDIKRLLSLFRQTHI
ncbi:MAG: hypothetical protein FWC27_14240 [Firmicutes bacterium]|nr:hypothetical protein [Bacillota bacterium]